LEKCEGEVRPQASATAREAERPGWPGTDRIRALREGPNGALWFLSENRGALYRVAPAEGG
jgi:glucose/arabinose dehydrogenase